MCQLISIHKTSDGDQDLVRISGFRLFSETYLNIRTFLTLSSYRHHDKNKNLTLVIPGQLPDDERLVPGGGQDHLRVLGVGSDLGNPSKQRICAVSH